MKRMCSMAIMLLTMTCGAGLADDACTGWRPWPRCFCTRPECPSLGGTPVDYCRKTIPCLTDVPRCGGPDDYCTKTIPCFLPPDRCSSPDDYCRKTIPCLVCPPASPYLYYGSPSPGCAPRRCPEICR